MTEPHPLQQLYDRKISFKIETFGDGGFEVALGDPPNGYKATGNAETFAEAVAWLVEQANTHFPHIPEEGILDD